MSEPVNLMRKLVDQSAAAAEEFRFKSVDWRLSWMQRRWMLLRSPGLGGNSRTDEGQPQAS